MTAQVLTTSAALYFDREKSVAVPLRWLEAARRFFEEYSLPLTFFCADCPGFLVDEFHEFARRESELIKGFRQGKVETVGLGSCRHCAGPALDWRAMASASLTDGVFYLGVDEDILSSPAVLLRRACEIAAGTLDVRYGIAYTSPFAEEPDCYAAGVSTYSLSQIRRIFVSEREGTRELSRIESWRKELTGKGRHLKGLFRGAYPANLLSESHLCQADLRSFSVGTLSQLDGRLWLWELGQAEIPTAQEILDSAGALLK